MEKEILLISYIFIVGSISGWFIEVLYRRIKNTEGKWKNPGLLSGPWLPIYGFGTTFLYWITSSLEHVGFDPIPFNLSLFIICAFAMSGMELVGGSYLYHFLHIRLWDYRNEAFNYKGYTCLKFFFIWGLSSLFYYNSIHKLIIFLVNRYFSNIGILSFIVGITWGVFIVDLWNSMEISVRISQFAKERNIVIDFEKVKDIAKTTGDTEERYAYRKHFFQVPRKENIIDFLLEHEPHISIRKHEQNKQ